MTLLLLLTVAVNVQLSHFLKELPQRSTKINLTNSGIPRIIHVNLGTLLLTLFFYKQLRFCSSTPVAYEICRFEYSSCLAVA